MEECEYFSPPTQLWTPFLLITKGSQLQVLCLACDADVQTLGSASVEAFSRHHRKVWLWPLCLYRMAFIIPHPHGKGWKLKGGVKHQRFKPTVKKY